MDIKELMGTMLSSETVGAIGKAAGASGSDVKSVLSSALPSLLEGAKGQAHDTATAEGFVGALSDHAKDNTSDISSFLSGVDLEDGGKIVGHLLGTDADKTTKAAADKAGVDKSKAGSILSAAAPLLMSLLGQNASSGANAESNNAGGIAGIMGSLLSNVDLGSVIGGLFSSNDTAPSNASASKKKKKTSKKDDEGGGFLSGLLGLFKG